MPLTDRQISRAKAINEQKTIRDGAGLYLVLKRSGTKVWRLDYTFAGKRRTLTIGQYPEVGLQEAREARLTARRQIIEGLDPSIAKQEQRRSLVRSTTNTVARAVDDHLDRLKAQGRASATIDKNEWLGAQVKNAFGSVALSEVRPGDILVLLRSLEAAGKLETARRIRTFVGSVYRNAILNGDADTDPSYALRGAIMDPRPQHHPAIIVEKDFGRLLNIIDTYKGYQVIRAALKMLSLTFVRPSELRFATWQDIDLEEAIWRIPAERTKMRRPLDVPLVPQSRAVLREMAICSKRELYIFPSKLSLRKPLSENTLNAALNRMGFEGVQTSHGFRASASSILNERGFRSDVIEMQLGHVDKNAVRRAYNRSLFWNERVEMMHEWAMLGQEFRHMAT